jgi:hypothetical protein
MEKNIFAQTMTAWTDWEDLTEKDNLFSAFQKQNISAIITVAKAGEGKQYSAISSPASPMPMIRYRVIYSGES